MAVRLRRAARAGDAGLELGDEGDVSGLSAPEQLGSTHQPVKLQAAACPAWLRPEMLREPSHMRIRGEQGVQDLRRVALLRADVTVGQRDRFLGPSLVHEDRKANLTRRWGTVVRASPARATRRVHRVRAVGRSGRRYRLPASNNSELGHAPVSQICFTAVMTPWLSGSPMSAVRLERLAHQGSVWRVAAGQRLFVVRGGVEPPTFRFSGQRRQALCGPAKTDVTDKRNPARRKVQNQR
jgi:hypothetical protein